MMYTVKVYERRFLLQFSTIASVEITSCRPTSHHLYNYSCLIYHDMNRVSTSCIACIFNTIGLRVLYAISFVVKTVLVSLITNCHVLEPNGHSAQRPTQDGEATTKFQTVRTFT